MARLVVVKKPSASTFRFGETGHTTLASGEAPHATCATIAFVLGAILLALCLITGCGSGSPAGSAQSSASQESSQSDSAFEQEEAAYRKDHMDAINGTWANEIILDALNKLAQDGAIAPLPEEPYLFTNVFEWAPAGGVEHNQTVNFTDEAAKERLTGSFSIPEGKKVVIATEKGFVFTTDKSMYYATGGKADAELANVPTFYPGSTFHATLSDDVPMSRFANTLDECDYIIAYDGVVTYEDEDYYVYGATGHFTTTFVIVVDARTHEVVHLETIGTSRPDPVVTVGGSPSQNNGSMTGRIMVDEAAAYIGDIL